MDEITKKAGLAMLLVFLIFIFGAIVINAIEKKEIIECEELQRLANKMPNFWITQWQKDMCDSYDIKLNIKVKK